MIVSTRLDDRLVEEIDRLAHAEGMTRAAWVARTLAASALASKYDNSPAIEVPERGHPDSLVRVTIRLSRREVEAIEKVSAPIGLNRIEWIKRALRWQLWDRAGALRLAPETQAEIGRLRKQVLAIGRNVNQAVHAMNAANQPDSALNIFRIAEQFTETCEDLRELLHTTRRELSSYVGAEVGYWVAAYRELRQ